MTTRKSRGRRTEALVAGYLRARGWPFAEPAGAGRPGVDVTGVPDLALEVKARTRLDPLAWIRQAETTDGRLPVVVARMNGQGEDAGRFVAFLRLADLVPLLHAAGYGDPPATDEPLTTERPPASVTMPRPPPQLVWVDPGEEHP